MVGRADHASPTKFTYEMADPWNAVIPGPIRPQPVLGRRLRTVVVTFTVMHLAVSALRRH
jgi:hypothetical protein